MKKVKGQGHCEHLCILLLSYSRFFLNLHMLVIQSAKLLESQLLEI